MNKSRKRLEADWKIMFKALKRISSPFYTVNNELQYDQDADMNPKNYARRTVLRLKHTIQKRKKKTKIISSSGT